MSVASLPLARTRAPGLDTIGAWLLAVVWIAPLLFAAWASVRAPAAALSFDLGAPFTLDNFRIAWNGAPWPRYFFNTVMLVTVILIGQFVLCTLAGYAFARFPFPGRDLLFILILMQLFILPEVL